jgi:uncharacterized membrane protein
MSNLQPLLTENLKNLKSSSFHYKFYSIVTFILAGIMIVLGIPLLLVLGFGLIYIAFGVFYIFLGLKIKNAQE